MNWTLLIIFFVIIAVLLILNVYLLDRVKKPLSPESRCRNCRTTIKDGWHDIHCTNRRSIYYRCTMDDFSRCTAYKPHRATKLFKRIANTKNQIKRLYVKIKRERD